MRTEAGLCVLVAGLGLGSLAQADSNGMALPGGDFEAGLGGWVQTSSDSQVPFYSILAPAQGQGLLAAACNLTPGQVASLERRVPIAPGEFVSDAPAPGVPGRKLEAGVWIWLSATAAGGDVWLEVASFDGVSTSPLASSTHWNVDLAPKSHWLFLGSDPLPGVDGRVPSGALELRYSLHASASGLVVFDAARVRQFEAEEVALSDASFEAWVPSQSPWLIQGTVLVGPLRAGDTGYFGLGHAVLDGASAPTLSQEVDLARPVDRYPLLGAGRKVEGGCWLRFERTAPLPQNPSASFFVELAVYAREASTGVERRVAHTSWQPVASQSEHWVYLETTPLSTLKLGESLLRIELGGDFQGFLAVDFAQLGELHGVDGNPRRRVGCNYVGRYRSPQFSTHIAADTPEDRWRNWHWQMPPACSSTFEGFFHSPDCLTSLTCRRLNGRRDLASSSEHSPDDLPLAGAYDSRDPDLIRYHLELAASAGIDHFIFDYMGHALAQQEIAQGRAAINETTYLTLLEECARPTQDLKLATMYEPKVHMLGWVQGEPTKQQKLDGISADLVYLAQTMAGQRGALRHDNRLVVFIFRNKLCNPNSGQCLLESDWVQIHGAVLAATGESLFLVGDAEPELGSALEGFTRWKLVVRDLLIYRNWSDVRDGLATLPVPQLASLVSHTQSLVRSVCDWQARADQERVAVLTVWPGFDDGGVGGWGQNNLSGEDGTPLCVRVADDFAGNFYTTTVASALAGQADWIQIATWNDWNEATRIEPAWHPGFMAPTLLGQQAGALVEQQVFGRLNETRQWIEAFKGEAAGGQAFRIIAGKYLRRAFSNPDVPLYD